MADKPKTSKKPSATKAESLLEQTTFFVDRSLGRHIGAALTGAGLLVQMHDDHFKDDTADEEWIAQVAAWGWVALTKDKAIRRKPRERAAVLNGGIAIFTLPNGNMTGQQMADTFVNNKLKMARFLLKHRRPFVAVVADTGIRLVVEEPRQ